MRYPDAVKTGRVPAGTMKHAEAGGKGPCTVNESGAFCSIGAGAPA